MKRHLRFHAVILFLAASSFSVCAQERDDGRFGAWLPYQLIPNLTLYSSSPLSGFGFEWEFSPALYSFGMNSQISPWYSFIVEPTARVTGSVELVAAGQVFTSKMGASYFSASGQLMGTIPLIERGEHLTLNLGVGAYHIAGETRLFEIAGISTLFGIVHMNFKHAARPSTWISSLEFRIF